MSWSQGLLECLDDKVVTLDTVCCMPCQAGRQCAAVNGEEDTMSIPHCMMAIIGGYGCVACCIRMKVSEKFNIGEGCIMSWCQAQICTCCSLVQTHNELAEHDGSYPGTFCAYPDMPDGPDVGGSDGGHGHGHGRGHGRGHGKGGSN